MQTWKVRKLYKAKFQTLLCEREFIFCFKVDQSQRLEFVHNMFHCYLANYLWSITFHKVQQSLCKISANPFSTRNNIAGNFNQVH